MSRISITVFLSIKSEKVMQNINNYKKSNIKMGFIKGFLLLFISSLPLHNSFASNDLSTLQKQIKVSKTAQIKKNKKRIALEESVAKLEQDTAAASLLIQETEEAINAEKERLEKLKDQSGTLLEAKQKQQKLLKQQLVSAYMSGQNDLLKVILNQDDISQLVRAKGYYTYLNKARFASIDALDKAQMELEANESDQASSLASLEKMHNEQKASQEELVAKSVARNKALKELKQDINYQKARIAQLNNAESKLKTKLQTQQAVRKKNELAKKAAAESQQDTRVESTNNNEDQIHSSFSTQKGLLNWPIRGDILAKFGSSRGSNVKWKGISISANEGQKVRAVATGRVLFAGYFKGYGMVIALDHSNDYITLYGYNQTLLQKTGDIVFQGDAIALAGHSGGQEQNNLYFEVSHKGKAEDPQRWLTKRR